MLFLTESLMEKTMQKKIIALAVAGLVSGGASAQVTNVTISGLFDAGLQWSTTEGSNQSQNAGYNNTATSNITVRATEDLGGGMRAGVVAETDLRGAGTLGGFQHYVLIGKTGIGELSLGQRTNMMTTAATTVQPFGTAIGGGYGGGFVRNRGGGFEATGAWSATGRDVRPDGAAHFRSDSFSGVSFGLDFKPTNSSAGETAASNGYLGLGVNYNNGPLNLTFAQSTAKNTTAAAAAVLTFTDTNGNGVVDAGETTVATAAVAAYNSTVKNTMLGGNYTMGAFTGYLGWGRSVADTSAAAGDEANSRSWNIGVRYVMGNWSFMANHLNDNDKLAADADRKLTGLGVDYSMSKRTALFARYQTLDTNTNTAGGRTNTTALGMRHSF
jgi:predicted porin